MPTKETVWRANTGGRFDTEEEAKRAETLAEDHKLVAAIFGACHSDSYEAHREDTTRRLGALSLLQKITAADPALGDRVREVMMAMAEAKKAPDNMPAQRDWRGMISGLSRLPRHR